MGRASEIFRLLIKNRAFSGMTPGNLCSLLEELGPFYIKLGQILAVGSGVLPEEYCRALSELRTDVTPMPYAQVREILEREYGRPPEEVFSEFRGEVLGSASVAQVHYARLKSGEEAAVKVQRPDTLRQFSRDLALFERLAPLVRLSPARKVVNFPQILGELRAAADAMEAFRRMPLREMDVTAFLGQFLTAARDCGVVMPRQVTMLTSGVVVLKGIIDGLAPNAELLSLLAAAIQSLNMRVI